MLQLTAIKGRPKLDGWSFWLSLMQPRHQSPDATCIGLTSSDLARAINASRKLAIVPKAPWAKMSRLEPTPSDAVLEINGREVGRGVFDAAR
jgi:hypothetical protein